MLELKHRYVIYVRALYYSVGRNVVTMTSATIDFTGQCQEDYTLNYIAAVTN